MASVAHRIRRQRWNVTAGSEPEALAVRRQLRELWEVEMQPAFQRAFDDVAPGPDVVRVPRLEVSVSVGDVHELAGVLHENVLRELRRLVEAAAPTQGAAAAPVPAAARPRNAHVVAPRARDSVLLPHYLAEGSVPWHAMEADQAPVIRELEAESRRSLEEALAVLHSTARDEVAFAAALFRLLQVLPEKRWASTIERVLSMAAARPAPNLVELIAEVAGPDGLAIPRHARLRLLASLVAGVTARLAIAPSQVSGLDFVAPEVVARIVEAWTRETGIAAPARVTTLVDRMGTTRPARGLSAAVREVRPSASSGHAAETPFAPRRQMDDQEPPLAVANAGLVLLHPYLAQLFKNARLTLSPGASGTSPGVARAAALLHRLATGRDEPYELELGFVKVLLGLTPETPLPVAGGLLGEDDRNEVEALLTAVVGHWTVLKHTSVSALRTSFLQRTGLLLSDENGWRLRIEPGPFDVLLERLPWGIGTVKLPWMSKAIFCEWPAA